MRKIFKTIAIFAIALVLLTSTSAVAAKYAAKAEEPAKAYTVLSNCDEGSISEKGWPFDATDEEEKMEGKASITRSYPADGSTGVPVVLETANNGVPDKKLELNLEDIGLTIENGGVAFWLYVGNRDAFATLGEVNISNGVAEGANTNYDKNRLSWQASSWATNLKTGWNYVKLDFSAAVEDNGPFDISAIKYFRVYLINNTAEPQTLKVDNIILYNKERGPFDVHLKDAVAYGQKFVGGSHVPERVEALQTLITSAQNPDEMNTQAKIDKMIGDIFEAVSSLDKEPEVVQPVVKKPATVLSNCDERWPFDITDEEEKMEGAASVTRTYPGPGDANYGHTGVPVVLATADNGVPGGLPLDYENIGLTKANGGVAFWLWVGNPAAFDVDGEVNLSSGLYSEETTLYNYDTNRYSWHASAWASELKAGWNYVRLDFESATESGTINLSAIKFFRVYLKNNTAEPQTLKVDNIILYNKEEGVFNNHLQDAVDYGQKLTEGSYAADGLAALNAALAAAQSPEQTATQEQIDKAINDILDAARSLERVYKITVPSDDKYTITDAEGVALPETVEVKEGESLSFKVDIAEGIPTDQLKVRFGAVELTADNGVYTIDSVNADGEITVDGLVRNVTVQFVSDGATIDTQTVTAGNRVRKPIDPVKEGYVFGGWYTDENCTIEYDFSKNVDENTTLYAKWTEKPAEKDPQEGGGCASCNGGMGAAGLGMASLIAIAVLKKKRS